MFEFERKSVKNYYETKINEKLSEREKKVLRKCAEDFKDVLVK